jgi:nitroreductase
LSFFENLVLNNSSSGSFIGLKNINLKILIMEYLKQFEWRYATKRMNGQKVPTEKLDNILWAVQLAPTSLGLQPFKVLVIESEEAKQKLSKACQQPQVFESSAILVFCHWTEVSGDQINEYITNIAETRNLELSMLNDFKNMIVGSTQGLNETAIQGWNARQTYIALGFGLAASAMENVDATPMEGFNSSVLDEVFNLPQKGLKSVALMAIGYRDAEKDYLANMKKVRRDKALLFERL